jgi:hypothetical protein
MRSSGFDRREKRMRIYASSQYLFAQVQNAATQQSSTVDLKSATSLPLLVRRGPAAAFLALQFPNVSRG